MTFDPTEKCRVGSKVIHNNCAKEGEPGGEAILILYNSLGVRVLFKSEFSIHVYIHVLPSKTLK